MGQLARLAAAPMKERQAHVERLRNDAAECATLSRLAVDEKKRELFADLAARLTLKRSVQWTDVEQHALLG